MTSIPSQAAHTKAVIDHLTAAGLTVVDGEKPGADTPHPFVMVWPFTRAALEGPVADPYADAAPQYQLRAVGLTRASAEVVGDRAREAMLDGTLTVAGRVVQFVDAEAQLPLARDDDVAPPLFTSAELFTVYTTSE